jgi:hypothetical protein
MERERGEEVKKEGEEDSLVSSVAPDFIYAHALAVRFLLAASYRSAFTHDYHIALQVHSRPQHNPGHPYLWHHHSDK